MNKGFDIKKMAGKALNLGNDMINSAKEYANNVSKKNKMKEIENRIIEHKYNIGIYIYDNDIDIDDGIVISNVNAIERLIDDIEKIGGNKNV